MVLKRIIMGRAAPRANAQGRGLLGFGLLGLAVLWAVVAGTAGCQSTARPKTVSTARFYLESAPHIPLRASQSVVMPLSGVRLNIGAAPVINELDIANVELVKVDLGLCLLFQLTGSGARSLYMVTSGNQGKRLVLTLNGEPAGVWLIDRPIGDGQLLTFTELEEGSLPEVVDSLRETIAYLQSRSQSR